MPPPTEVSYSRRPRRPARVRFIITACCDELPVRVVRARPAAQRCAAPAGSRATSGDGMPSAGGADAKMLSGPLRGRSGRVAAMRPVAGLGGSSTSTAGMKTDSAPAPPPAAGRSSCGQRHAAAPRRGPLHLAASVADEAPVTGWLRLRRMAGIMHFRCVATEQICASQRSRVDTKCFSWLEDRLRCSETPAAKTHSG